MKTLSLIASRAWLSLTTIPNSHATLSVIGITAATTLGAGMAAAGSGFIDPIQDFDPPWMLSRSAHSIWMKPLSAFVFPSLVEELFWRGMLLPHPSNYIVPGAPSSSWVVQAGIVLMIHVAIHPLAGWTVWPRGRKVFDDPRFLCIATIVLAGATASYFVSGGSVWATAFTHGLPVALWRDFFGGEAKLLLGSLPKNDRKGTKFGKKAD
jgi:predicted Abi (CAAX) family protease